MSHRRVLPPRVLRARACCHCVPICCRGGLCQNNTCRLRRRFGSAAVSTRLPLTRERGALPSNCQGENLQQNSPPLSSSKVAPREGNSAEAKCFCSAVHRPLTFWKFLMNAALSLWVPRKSINSGTGHYKTCASFACAFGLTFLPKCGQRIILMLFSIWLNLFQSDKKGFMSKFLWKVKVPKWLVLNLTLDMSVYSKILTQKYDLKH